MHSKIEHSSSALDIVFDINARFLKGLGSFLAPVLQAIRVGLGVQLSMNYGNCFNFYGVDSVDVFKLYESSEEHVENFNYGKEFAKIQDRLVEIVSKKGMDEGWESKLVKGLTQILCRINKYRKENPQKKQQNRVLIITSRMFQMSSESYASYLSLATYCGKQNVRIDLIEINLMQNYERNNQMIGIEGVKLGVQLSSGIPHDLELQAINSRIFAQMLLSSFDPGPEHEFISQPKFNKLSYKAFCCGCDTLIQDEKDQQSKLAFSCSNCLAIHCEKCASQYCSKCRSRFQEIKTD